MLITVLAIPIHMVVARMKNTAYNLTETINFAEL